ncbi:MAG: thermonuclease family protein [Methanotrichaceae archaeon]|jgi:micrococcal nuclease
MKLKFLVMAFLLLGVATTQARYDEVVGSVTHVIDGDTFDVHVNAGNNGFLDSRVVPDSIIRIRPADINCPETRGSKKCAAGFAATNYTRSWLLGKTVYLDLDNKTGKDQYGRWVAMVYLPVNGTMRNFNKMLITSGHAVMDDFNNNEFEPAIWMKEP